MTADNDGMQCLTTRPAAKTCLTWIECFSSTSCTVKVCCGLVRPQIGTQRSECVCDSQRVITVGQTDSPWWQSPAGLVGAASWLPALSGAQ